jgi:hypothetical protein
MTSNPRYRRLLSAVLVCLLTGFCVEGRTVEDASPRGGTSTAHEPRAAARPPVGGQGGVDVQFRVRLSKAGSSQASEALRVNVGAYTHEYIDPFLWEQFFSRLRVGDVVLDPAGITRKSTSLQDFKVKIRELDGLVMRIVEAGGRVRFVFSSMMPRWLSRDASNEQRLFTGPSEDRIWHNAPPRDPGQWSELMKAFVHHFNRELQTHGRVSYNIGGEPDNYWVGSEAEFHEFYRASVRGALAADPKARIGGITPANPLANRFTKARHKGRDAQFDPEYTAGQRPMIENWIRFCRQNDLPIHFVSWHDYPVPNPIPGEISSPRLTSSLVASWLREHGYPDAELLVMDWPDWKSVPEENDGSFMASYAATGVISFLEGGVAKPVYIGLRDQRAYLDQKLARANAGFGGGTGLMTNAGVPKPVFNAYHLISMMEGRLALVDTGDDFVTALASKTADRAYLLVSNFVPSDRVLRANPGLALSLPDGEMAKVEGYLRGLPSVQDFRTGVLTGRVNVAGLPLPAEYKRRLARYQEMVLAIPERRERPARVTIRVEDLPAGSWSYREYILDDENASSYTRRAELHGPLMKAVAAKDGTGARRLVQGFNEKTSVDASVSVSLPVQVASGVAAITTTLRPLGVHLIVLEQR